MPFESRLIAGLSSSFRGARSSSIPFLFWEVVLLFVCGGVQGGFGVIVFGGGWIGSTRVVDDTEFEDFKRICRGRWVLILVTVFLC